MTFEVPGMCGCGSHQITCSIFNFYLVLHPVQWRFSHNLTSCTFKLSIICIVGFLSISWKIGGSEMSWRCPVQWIWGQENTHMVRTYPYDHISKAPPPPKGEFHGDQYLLRGEVTIFVLACKITLSQNNKLSTNIALSRAIKYPELLSDEMWYFFIRSVNI